MRLIKGLRVFAAIALAFGSLFWTTPAKAYYLDNNYIQFTYYWEDYSFEVADSILEITVINNITNKIGGDGEVIDTYRITVGDQVIEVSEKHDALTYSFEVVGNKVITLGGIDNGYWGGNHGPIMSWTINPIATPEPEPAPTESEIINWWQSEWWEGTPVTISVVSEGYVFSDIRAWYGDPNGTCGIDVSTVLNPIIVDNSSASFVVSNDLFTDPCPGVVKVLRFAASLESTPEPSPSEPEPEPTLSPAPSPTPEPTETQEPIVEPTPLPSPLPEPQPTVESEPLPLPLPQPEPSPEPAPLPEPTVEPVPNPEPTLEPTPSPSPSYESTPEETTKPVPTDPTPIPSEEPTDLPAIEPTKIPEPEPLPTLEPTPSTKPEPIVPEEEGSVKIEVPITAENIEALVEELSSINPQQLTEEQVEVLVSIAMQTFETASVGSPEYEQALDLLLIAAQADDVVLDESIAAIPLIGNVAGAAVEVFNAIGNAGADMSPKVREQSEKVVVAAVIVGQIAMTATAAATSAAAVAARRP